MYVEALLNVKYIKMRKLTIFITAVRALFWSNLTMTQEQKSQYIIIILI